MQRITSQYEGTLKRSPIIHDNEMADSELQQDLLHKIFSNNRGCHTRNRDNYNKLCEVTHKIQKVVTPGVISKITGASQIYM